MDKWAPLYKEWLTKKFDRVSFNLDYDSLEDYVESIESSKRAIYRKGAELFRKNGEIVNDFTVF